MPKAKTVICNELGLHARAAAKLVDLANRYASEITIGREDKSVNGKSIMGVLMLAAAQGSSISVSTEGPDADQALADLLALIDSGFGEN